MILSEKEREKPNKLVKGQKTGRGCVIRAQIILKASEDPENKGIAKKTSAGQDDCFKVEIPILLEKNEWVGRTIETTNPQ